jgi:hypothetical protein
MDGLGGAVAERSAGMQQLAGLSFLCPSASRQHSKKTIFNSGPSATGVDHEEGRLIELIACHSHTCSESQDSRGARPRRHGHGRAGKGENRGRGGPGVQFSIFIFKMREERDRELHSICTVCRLGIAYELL